MWLEGTYITKGGRGRPFRSAPDRRRPMFPIDPSRWVLICTNGWAKRVSLGSHPSKQSESADYRRGRRLPAAADRAQHGNARRSLQRTARDARCSMIDSSGPKAVARAGLCRANISRGIPRGRRASLCTATAMLASVDDTHRRSWEGVTYTRANGVRGWARLWCILGARRAACAPMAFSRFLRLWLGNGERHCSEQTRRRRRRMAVGRSRRAEAQQARVGDEVCIG